MKKEFKIISELIENNTRVLDVGCGDGTLMKYLKDKKMLILEDQKYQKIMFKIVQVKVFL